MGRIKTQLIKRTSTEIYTNNPNNFSNDFNSNKKKVDEAADIPSKKMRNSIAGYLTRLAKRRQQE